MQEYRSAVYFQQFLFLKLHLRKLWSLQNIIPAGIELIFSPGKKKKITPTYPGIIGVYGVLETIQVQN